MKRQTVAIWLTILVAGPIAAIWAGPAEGPRVNTARQNAVASLRSQMQGIRLTGNITVDDFLVQTQASDALSALAAKAHSLGGPRWIDDQTVQVKLELPGADLIGQLISIAATHPENPISPVLLDQRLK